MQRRYPCLHQRLDIKLRMFREAQQSSGLNCSVFASMSMNNLGTDVLLHKGGRYHCNANRQASTNAVDLYGQRCNNEFSEQLGS